LDSRLRGNDDLAGPLLAVLLLSFMLRRTQHEWINLRQVDNVAPKTETRYIPAMHFSRHISQLHSTFSLLAALKLRFAR
jgi:hypothetical protein